MKTTVQTRWSGSYEFACHSKACAPPPVGSGGSKGGSGRGAAAEAYVRANPYRGGSRAAYQAKMQKALASAAPTFKVITAAQARGDSRPVSHAEFQRLARIGQEQLDKMKADASPTTGLDKGWERIKAATFLEVQKEWGGATIDSHTGRALPQGENKYALTVKESGHSTVSVPEKATQEEFNTAMDEAKRVFGPVLERQGHHLGVFHDDENHRIDIDPVIVVTNRSDVDTIGAATHAIGGAYNFMDGNGYWPPHVSEG